MSERDDPQEPAAAPERTPGREAASEAAPDWAAEIHRLRRVQGDRLRRLLSTFDEEQEER